MSDSIKQRLKVGPLPDDNTLDLAFITDADSLCKLLNKYSRIENLVIDSIRLQRLRYHPGASCNLLFTVQFHDPVIEQKLETAIYATLLNSEKFTKAVSRAREMTYLPGQLTVSPVIDNNHRCLLYEFPNDAALANLSLLKDMNRLRELVKQNDIDRFGWIGPDCSVEQLRYKPENRFVGIIRSPKGDEIVIRFEGHESIARLRKRMTQLEELDIPDDSVTLALPVFCDESTGLVGMEKLPGEKLSEILRTDESVAGLKQGAHALATLHSASTHGLPAFNSETKINSLMRFLTKLERGSLTPAGSAINVADWIRRETVKQDSGSICLIHGDFHPGQVLVGHNITYIIDLDRMASGAPEVDMGNFIAQLVFLNMRMRLSNCESFEELVLETYSHESKKHLDGRQVLFWKVIGLVELAAKQYRRLKPGWPESVMEIFAHISKAIERPMEIS